MENNRVLSCEYRSNFGSSSARRIRAKYEIPAVVYGQGNDVSHLKIKNSEFNKKFAKFTDNTVLILNDGKLERCVFVKDVAENIASKLIYHIDFYEVDRHVELERYVPIKLTGASVGVKEGGVLTVLKEQVKVKSLPLDLPEFIELDLTPVNKGDSFLLKDLILPSNVRLAENDENLEVVTIK
ncbi:50S ribosomal protein L25/general stress protein Ctc [Borreliella yangtzensis]|uniref:Large ribosomal subunit protein bL25 n=1 Tax=Borreliella yangtzensis TaxID=683292 RepID=A0ABR6P924_9SPIR|nr:50S ribosomal protein L25/general stress protein Ctc [Borreliella yangtzensis]MBB6042767.1 large subunit ribosomal protein L25 [Borreliella yangtzensis]WKC73723.1 50S ribosomal protein L25/general stress protein Ctc [Borreliella yangtzensis]WKC74639.1 50S ribosomal protein L25/general stress protein Ctc [Borreliella yangtzensis]